MSSRHTNSRAFVEVILEIHAIEYNRKEEEYGRSVNIIVHPLGAGVQPSSRRVSCSAATPVAGGLKYDHLLLAIMDSNPYFSDGSKQVTQLPSASCKVWPGPPPDFLLISVADLSNNDCLYRPPNRHGNQTRWVGVPCSCPYRHPGVAYNERSPSNPVWSVSLGACESCRKELHRVWSSSGCFQTEALAKQHHVQFSSLALLQAFATAAGLGTAHNSKMTVLLVDEAQPGGDASTRIETALW